MTGAAAPDLDPFDPEILEQEADNGPRESLQEAITRLAALPALPYERVRAAEAKQLGIRTAILDREVALVRKAQAGGEDEPPPLVAEVLPWVEAVDGGALLAEIQANLTRHMALPEGAAEVLPIWILGTYCFDAFRIWPKLLLTSPEKRCGKSTLLSGLLAPMVQRGLVASSISPAAVYRVIEACKPTLLLDEADRFLAHNEELNGVINSGHTRSGAFVIRTVGDEHEPRRFSTWAPMAIAMIKLPQGTLIDRSIVIRLRRRLPGEQVEKLPLTFEDSCLALRRKARRWGDDHLSVLRGAQPRLPPSGNDRTLDNWSPLFAIAEVAGGDWPRAVRAAFSHITAGDDEDDAIGPTILADIRQVFGTRERMHSTDLVAELVALEERPWSEWRQGKPLTTTGLSRLLKPFRIKARQLRIGPTNRNGYERKEFIDAFARYLPAATGVDHDLEGTV